MQRLVLLPLLLMGLLGAGESGCRAASVDYTGFDPALPVARYVLSLPQAAGGRDLTIQVWRRGDFFSQAWAVTADEPAYALSATCGHGGFYNFAADAGLHQAGGKLTGVLYRGQTNRYEIDATVAGTVITGSFAGTCADGKGREMKVAGTLAGKVLDAAAMAAAVDPLAEGAAYPCFRNDGSGCGHDAGVELVRDPSRARLLWKSEDLVPAPYAEGNNLDTDNIDMQTGHASVVLADGKLYLSYFVGALPTAPDEIDEANTAKKLSGGNKPEKFAPRIAHLPESAWLKKLSKVADQVVVCIDAQSGRTLWKTCYPKDGPNIAGAHGRHGIFGPSSKAASHLTPCVGGGRVFAKSTAGHVYALDAATGRKLWRVEYPKPERGGPLITDAVMVIDGVVATTHVGGLNGLDAATGRQLWVHKDMVGGKQTVYRWVHEGKASFLSPQGHCIEPASGKVLWQAKGLRSGVLAAGEGHIVSGNQDGITCHRIGPGGASLAWELTDWVFPRTVHPVIYRGKAWCRALPKGENRNTYDTLCIDLATGEVAAKMGTGSKSYSSICAGDGRLFNCNAAVVVLQDATDPGGTVDLLQERGGRQVNGPCPVAGILQGTPETTGIYADGRFYSRCFDGVVAYDLRAAAK